MAQYNITNFKSLFGVGGTIFADNTTQQISEADMRDFGEAIADSFGNILSLGTVSFALWNGVAFPTPTATTIYVVTADHGTLGDPDYVPANAWMIGPAGATVFADFYIKP